MNVPYKRELVQRAAAEISLIARAADLPDISLDPDVKSSLIKDKDTSSSLIKDKDTSSSLIKDKDTSSSLIKKVKRSPPYPSNSKKINVGKVFKWCQFDVYKNGHMTRQPVSTKSEHELPTLHSKVNKYLLPAAEMANIGTRPRLDGVQQIFNADKRVGA